MNNPRDQIKVQAHKDGTVSIRLCRHHAAAILASAAIAWDHDAKTWDRKANDATTPASKTTRLGIAEDKRQSAARFRGAAETVRHFILKQS